MARGNMKVNMKAFEERREIKRHKINDGVNIFRVLPPFGEEAEGYPYRRWSIAWLADPESGRNRPYASPWSFGEKECPVGEYAKALQDKRESLEKKLASQDLSKEEIRDKLKPISEILWKIKPKATYFYNAVNKSGEVGILELKKSAHDEMKKVMKEYIADYNQDPTSLNSDSDDSGLWFKITKTGVRMDTEYKVEKNQIKVKDAATGKLSFQDDQEALPESIVENYDDLANDLFKLYRQVSYDALKDVLLVNIGNFYEVYTKEFGREGANLIKIPGFEFDSTSADEEVEEVKPVAKKPVAAAVAKKPMPKFDDEDEAEDEYVPPVRTKSKVSAPKIDQDLFDEADDLLS
jgi:hypothetical protein